MKLAKLPALALPSAIEKGPHVCTCYFRHNVLSMLPRSGGRKWSEYQRFWKKRYRHCMQLEKRGLSRAIENSLDSFASLPFVAGALLRPAGHTPETTST